MEQVVSSAGGTNEKKNLNVEALRTSNHLPQPVQLVAQTCREQEGFTQHSTGLK